MNFICFTFSGEGLGVAEHLKREGNPTLIAMINDEKDILLDSEKEHYKGEDPKKKERRLALYDGIIKKHSAKSMVKFLKGVPKSERKNYFLFFDFNQNWKFAEQLIDEGYHGNFPTQRDRKFETDREFSKQFVRDFYPDIKVADEQEFKSINDGIKFLNEFLNETQDLWVLKGNNDDAKTVVPDKDDPEQAKEQLINALTEDKKLYEKDGFILEKKIADVMEVTPEIQFYNGEPLFATVDLENKQIGAGNEGFMTGCAQDLVFPLDLKSKLAQISFPDVVYGLAKMHKGWFIWDLSILFDRKTGEPYMGELCPNRPGYNALMTELALLDTTTEFFETIIKQKNPLEKAVGKFSSSVRLFNFDKDSKTLLPPLDNKITFTEETYHDLWLWNAKKKGREYLTTGTYFDSRYTDLAVITGYGNTIEESAKRMYMYVKGFNFEGIYNRPYFDYVSTEYPTSIINRYNFLKDNKLI